MDSALEVRCQEVHTESHQLPGSFHRCCLTLFSSYNFYGFFICIPWQLPDSDENLNWVQGCKAVCCFFSSENNAEIRSSRNRKYNTRSDCDNIWSWLMCMELEPVTST